MQRKMIRGRMVTTLALVAVSGLAGCTAQANDRTGGNAGSAVRVLTLASANDGLPPELSSWIDDVHRRSHGTLRVEVKRRWRSGEPTAEAGIVGDVSDGKVDLAWVGARAFDRFGVTSFQPLLAPMLIDSQALQAKVFSAGIAAEAVKGVDSAGLVGLGVLPGPLRKVLGVARSFVSPADFAGRTVGDQDGVVAQQTLRALGAAPRPMPAGARLDGLDGYEQQLSSIWGSHYELTAKYVTSNLNLWPRPLVVFASRKVLTSLAPDQQDALRNAAADSLASTLKAARTEDETAVPDLCRSGMVFPVATDQDLRALRTAVQPVYDQLDRHPRTKTVVDRIQGIKDALGARPDAASCTGQKDAAPGSSAAAIPDGTYRMTLTDAEAQRCATDSANLGGPFELQLRNGQVREYERRGGTPLSLGWYGSYRVFRDRFELRESAGGGLLTALWTFDGKALTLTHLQNGECGDATVWTTHPWVLDRPDAAAAARPAGVYHATVTTADWTAKRLSGTTGRFSLTFDGDSVTLTEPGGAVGFAGTFTLFRDRIKIVTQPDTITATWAVRGSRLRLDEVAAGRCSDCGPFAVVLGSHPWTRR